MHFIQPSVEYWPQGVGMEGVWKQIARATRICYQSAPRENETDEEFVKRVILRPALVEGDLEDLKHCEFNNLKLHGGALEHGSIYLRFVGKALDYFEDTFDVGESKPYCRFNADTVNARIYVSTNLRFIIENNLAGTLKYIYPPTKYHSRRYSFNVITDIGVTREFNRHRASMSIVEESTRYCDYTKDKYNGELTFIKPAWWREPVNNIFETEEGVLQECYEKIEDSYQLLRRLSWKPEQARQVLPLGLKTQAVYTAFADDWKHFLALRADNISGKSHPNMQLIANKIKKIAKEQKLW